MTGAIQHYQQLAQQARIEASLAELIALCETLGIGGAVVNKAKEALKNETYAETSPRSA